MNVFTSASSAAISIRCAPVRSTSWRAASTPAPGRERSLGVAFSMWRTCPVRGLVVVCQHPPRYAATSRAHPQLPVIPREDKRVVDAVKKTGRQQLIFAALWTEICLAYPVIHSIADGYDVFFVTDASGGTTREAHDMAVQRLIQAGATPLTWMGVMTEWQRD